VGGRAASFREYGLPEAIPSDNRTPFAARAVNGMSRLSLWWMKLGMRPEGLQAGHAEQNGRLERIHSHAETGNREPAGRLRRGHRNTPSITSLKCQESPRLLTTLGF